MINIAALDVRFDRWDELLVLILDSFAYMNGIIDPPSSALALTSESLRRKALEEVAFTAQENGKLVGCIFCRPEPPECIYVGKLAVDPATQGRGIGKALMSQAESVARQMGVPALRLETRIELVGNHERFAALGFVRTAEGRHRGYDRTTFIEMRKLL